jgi:hypothetical protein
MQRYEYTQGMKKCAQSEQTHWAATEEQEEEKIKYHNA